MSITIHLTDVAKRFGRQWLYQNVSSVLQMGKSYALTGNNGSGKSTLLQIIYGYQTPTKGKVEYLRNKEKLNQSEWIKYISYTAPYIDLPDELTLEEQLNFHFQFKSIVSGFTIDDVIEACWLTESRHKKIKHFSSGMKQRVKLAQVFFADTPVYLLDEPCTNLDERGIEWYRQEIISRKNNRLIVIASNQAFEYDFVDEQIKI
ncbi:MAG: ABC transporter ATP-binding protein [Bacteroidia bacterium]|nr:ABC transporter ATP-binding protein [Bacteroidia bacterium]MCC7534243.1 ABC transporter ATP-binding protein [Bacteroidia bacterium]